MVICTYMTPFGFNRNGFFFSLYGFPLACRKSGVSLSIHYQLHQCLKTGTNILSASFAMADWKLMFNKIPAPCDVPITCTFRQNTTVNNASKPIQHRSLN